MDQELKQRLDAIDQQLSVIQKQGRQTKAYIGWQLAIQIIMIILPIIILAVMIPLVTSMMSSITGGMTGEFDTQELIENVEELQQMI